MAVADGPGGRPGHPAAQAKTDESRQQRRHHFKELGIQLVIASSLFVGVKSDDEACDQDKQQHTVKSLNLPADGFWKHDVLINHVAVAAACLDKILAHLFADVANMDVQEIGKGIVLFRKEVVIKVGAADDFPTLKGEKLDEAVFSRG